jgi:hypothetical protein
VQGRPDAGATQLRRDRPRVLAAQAERAEPRREPPVDDAERGREEGAADGLLVARVQPRRIERPGQRGERDADRAGLSSRRERER